MKILIATPIPMFVPTSERPFFVPFFGDQPFWGRHVHLLGAGTEPIPQKKLTGEKLATAIKDTISNPDIQRKAKDIGEKIRKEDGIGNAVAVIEKIMMTYSRNLVKSG